RDVDRARLVARRHAPHVLEELGAADDLPGAAHEPPHDVDLASGQRDLRTPALAGARREIDRAPIDLDELRLARRERGSPSRGADAPVRDNDEDSNMVSLGENLLPEASTTRACCARLGT